MTVAGVAIVMAAVLALGAVASGSSKSGKSLASEGRAYVYLKMRGTYTVAPVYHHRSWSVFVPETTELWVARNGSGRQRQISGVPKFASEEDHRIWEEVGKPRFLAQGFHAHTGTQTFPAGGFPEGLYWDGLLSEMPADPEAVTEWLRSQANAPTNGGGNGFPDSVKILDLLQFLASNPLATQEQRDALFAATKEVPGIEQMGEASDEVGRRGVGVSAVSANSGALSRYSMIFDPETSRLLSYEIQRLETLPGRPEQAVPVLEARTTYLQSALVFSKRAKPRG